MPLEIIPAIDIIDGKCVRLNQGDYSRKTVYNENPLEVARMFEDMGLKRLHMVDLDGAKAHHIVNYKVLETVASGTSLLIDFGGGLKSDEDLRIAFASGADLVTGGSITVKSPETMLSWIQNFGPGRIILGADVSNRMIAVSGWLEDTGLEIMAFLEHWSAKGIEQAICTDISKDGMLAGPATDLYKEILQKQPELFLIASGGVSSLSDLMELEQKGIPAVIVGKAFYEGRITASDLQRFLK
ncbi:MAG: 1-(5-phosphoribosyl)-5-[(5-phosphoribosylamino)methylideneamino]imidazole-4-carboxamide isomerase [Marinilabiliales bacterium]|nr:1-(5-phosphoribosyl)-5-[(5-phosphoribosylamino)methylideneamino]imidazole-4-carboxamide isomerase [Marinilabiliales bacterium]